MDVTSREQTSVNLFNEVKRLEEENYKYKMSLETCKMYAENIDRRGYGESMDAHYIIEEVNEILNDNHS